MCFVNHSICKDCKTVTETQTPNNLLCARTPPDVCLRGCDGHHKVVVDVQHTSSEFCLNCYNQKLTEIQTFFGDKRERSVKKAKKQGYTGLQIELLEGEVEREMKREVGRLDREWEGKWCV